MGSHEAHWAQDAGSLGPPALIPPLYGSAHVSWLEQPQGIMCVKWDTCVHQERAFQGPVTSVVHRVPRGCGRTELGSIRNTHCLAGCLEPGWPEAGAESSAQDPWRRVMAYCLLSGEPALHRLSA